MQPQQVRQLLKIGPGIGFTINDNTAAFRDRALANCELRIIKMLRANGQIEAQRVPISTTPSISPSIEPPRIVTRSFAARGINGRAAGPGDVAAVINGCEAVPIIKNPNVAADSAAVGDVGNCPQQ